MIYNTRERKLYVHKIYDWLEIEIKKIKNINKMFKVKKNCVSLLINIYSIIFISLILNFLFVLSTNFILIS